MALLAHSLRVQAIGPYTWGPTSDHIRSHLWPTSPCWYVNNVDFLRTTKRSYLDFLLMVFGATVLPTSGIQVGWNRGALEVCPLQIRQRPSIRRVGNLLRRALGPLWNHRALQFGESWNYRDPYPEHPTVPL